MSKTQKTGRAPKISKELIDTIEKALRSGVYIETAISVACIDVTTLGRWMKIGQASKKGLHRELYLMMTRTIADKEVRQVQSLTNIGLGHGKIYERTKAGELVKDAKGNPILIADERAPDWRASAWWLERRFKNRWSPKSIVETIDPEADVPVPTTDEELVELENELKSFENARKLTDD